LYRLKVEGIIVGVQKKIIILEYVQVDLKTTLNPKLQIEQHPLPRVNNVFNKLSGGSVFTVLDLAEAYLQLQAASESRKFLTINTHKGLYCFNRLCYG